MIGLTLLLIFAVYAALVIKLARFMQQSLGLRHSFASTLVLASVYLALPVSDEIVGRMQYSRACEKIAGHHVAPAIQSAKLAKIGDWPPPTEELSGWIPMTKRTWQVLSVPDGTVVMEHDTITTPGGWLMRAGLNLGNTSSCNYVNTAKVMMQYGFQFIDGVNFERTNGRQIK